MPLSFLFYGQVFSTLSFSGSNLFSKLNRSFDVVVIDEAAQAVHSFTHMLYINSTYVGTQ